MINIKEKSLAFSCTAGSVCEAEQNFVLIAHPLVLLALVNGRGGGHITAHPPEILGAVQLVLNQIMLLTAVFFFCNFFSKRFLLFPSPSPTGGRARCSVCSGAWWP